MLNRLATQFDFHGEALKLRSERQRVIASNIANADTPGYQARELEFKSALANATRGLPGVSQLPSMAGSAPLAATNAAHVSVPTMALAKPGETPLSYRVPMQGALDANTVDMDVERAQFADNSVRYEASLRFLNGQIKTMNLAVTGQ
jgi:flagellar basal-body rod protein FlgB